MPSNSAEADRLHFRRYGDHGPIVYLLHGGPGAPGYLAPVARGLAKFCRIVEPFQRRSGSAPLTVKRHTEDLHLLISEQSPSESTIIVGHSWGAMLALAFAAQHPECVSSLVLIGCGTFDLASRQRMAEIRESRMTEEMRERRARFLKRFPDPNARLRAMGSLYQRIDSVDLLTHRDETAEFDARGNEETWSDMLRLQAEGFYPAAFASISAPILMLHGADDPHPGPMIRDSLLLHLPQLQYHEFADCGHYPWLERAAHDKFFDEMRNWVVPGERRTTT